MGFFLIIFHIYIKESNSWFVPCCCWSLQLSEKTNNPVVFATTDPTTAPLRNIKGLKLSISSKNLINYVLNMLIVPPRSQIALNLAIKSADELS